MVTEYFKARDSAQRRREAYEAKRVGYENELAADLTQVEGLEIIVRQSLQAAIREHLTATIRNSGRVTFGQLKEIYCSASGAASDFFGKPYRPLERSDLRRHLTELEHDGAIRESIEVVGARKILVVYPLEAAASSR